MINNLMEKMMFSDSLFYGFVVPMIIIFGCTLSTGFLAILAVVVTRV